MRFRVIWTVSALNSLAASYLYARYIGRDPEAVTAAMAIIDKSLDTNPATVGESRFGPIRVLIENPITVFFEVHDDEMIVVVTSVRYHTRSPKV